MSRFGARFTATSSAPRIDLVALSPYSRTARGLLADCSWTARWQRDFFYTPALRAPAVDAPLCGFSTQALDQMFVEWVTEPMYPSPKERMHRRLIELSRRWSTRHPCWHPGTMPLLADTEDWPADAVRAALGIGP
jgi:hypothetical protein